MAISIKRGWAGMNEVVEGIGRGDGLWAANDEGLTALVGKKNA